MLKEIASKTTEELQNDLKEANKKLLIYLGVGGAVTIFSLWSIFKVYASMSEWVNRGDSAMFMYALLGIVGCVAAYKIKGPMQDAQYTVQYLRTELAKRQ